MLSLINVEINASTDQFESAMWKSADIADASMSAAAANADRFQSAFDRASVAAGQSSQKMAGDFEAANERIIGAAGESSEAIDAISQSAAQIDASSWTEKISAALGAGFATGLVVAQTWMDKVEEFVKMKLVVIAATLTQFGMPEAGLLLILGVDHFLDMGRTATNVLGNAIATAVVAKWENGIDPVDAALADVDEALPVLDDGIVPVAAA